MREGVYIMKIEKLMPYKLKICITEEDLDDWQLRQEDITKNTSRTREMFVYILKTAKRETGFYFENSRLIIENLKKEYINLVY